MEFIQIRSLPVFGIRWPHCMTGVTGHCDSLPMIIGQFRLRTGWRGDWIDRYAVPCLSVVVRATGHCGSIVTQTVHDLFREHWDGNEQSKHSC